MFICARFDPLAKVLVNNKVLLYMKPSRLASIYQHFEAACCLHRQEDSERARRFPKFFYFSPYEWRERYLGQATAITFLRSRFVTVLKSPQNRYQIPQVPLRNLSSVTRSISFPFRWTTRVLISP